MRLLTIISFVIVITLLPACRKEVEDAPNIKDPMLAAVNSLRQTGCRCGDTFMPPVQPVVWNDTLAAAALAHDGDMSTHNYLSHISPNGFSPIQRTMALGYGGNTITENIARGYNDINSVMEAWQKSEGHCKAMMDSLQTQIGAARVNSYWVQEFGSYR